jgi:integrase/recombinase XerD
MLEELERRNYSESTTRRYLRYVERFAQHFGKSPDRLGPDHLRKNLPLAGFELITYGRF